MIVRVLTTCHTQYTWDRSICIFLFNITTPQGFVTYLTGALYVHPLWSYKHQHDNRAHSKLFVACQRWWFQWWFWSIPSVPGYLREEKEHKPDPWRNPIERNHMGLHLENQVYFVWQVVKTPTVILNHPVLCTCGKGNETIKTVSCMFNSVTRIALGADCTESYLLALFVQQACVDKTTNFWMCDEGCLLLPSFRFLNSL